MHNNLEKSGRRGGGGGVTKVLLPRRVAEVNGRVSLITCMTSQGGGGGYH